MLFLVRSAAALCAAALLAPLAAAGEILPPAPCGPVPTPRQLAWHDRQFYAFVHFGMNTFSDVEWGQGSESPADFNPSALDCRQWCRIFKEAGMTAVIITAKHHDGFCLWPSRFTEHDVASSPWKAGKGDVLAELSAACRELGLGLGVYISPWDRNHPLYGRDDSAYNAYFKGQLAELLASYGPICEIWFDGANGDRDNPEKYQEYDWEGFVAVVRKLQPDAVIFSDAGPDVRWIGNEHGYASPTQWATQNRDAFFPGIGGREQLLNTGEEGGTHWVPGEVDVSIRPGWFYHAAQDDQVKSVEQLLKIYYESVGHNANLLLNIPVDRRGLVHENDSANLLAMGRIIKETFRRDLAAGAEASASAVRGNDARFGAGNATDGDPSTYWAANDNELGGAITVMLKEPAGFDRIVLAEHIELGQRVRGFFVEARSGGEWTMVAEGTTIGNRRILRIPPVRADAVRLTITDTRACPTLESLSLFASPRGA